MAKTVYGKTWWGKKWLEVFTGIDEASRLSRGKTYANTGRVSDVEIEKNCVIAQVDGTRLYRVSVRLNKFNKKDLDIIKKSISGSSTVIADLLNKKLPEELFEQLKRNNILLFPEKWKDLKASCSCPDDAVPCKHIAAVIYIVAAEIDKNPFIIFDMHGCKLLELIEDFNEGKFQETKKIVQVKELFEPLKHAKKSHFKQEDLDTLDFSNIKNLRKTILGVLKKSTAFFQEDFREVIDDFYLLLKMRIDAKLKYQFGQTENLNRQENYREAFFKKWENPQEWDTFTFHMTSFYRISSIQDKNIILYEKELYHVEKIVGLLEEMPFDCLALMNKEIRFMHALLQFVKKCIEQSAIIPHIVQNEKNESFIRWVPALFDEAINTVFEQFCALCPATLVVCEENKKISFEEQVKTVFGLFCGMFVEVYPYPVRDDILKLFFSNKFIKFKKFTDKEIPSAIQEWLSPLFFINRPYSLYLKIDEGDGRFFMHLEVLLKNKKSTISFKEALKAEKGAFKLSLFSDCALISDYVPNFKKILEDDEKVFFDNSDFITFFLHILPILKAIGITIVLPKSLQNIIKPRLHLSFEKKKSISKAASLLSLGSILDFDWKIALGNQKISVAEFKKKIKESRGLVKMIDGYILIDETEMASLLARIDKLPNKLSNVDMLQASLAQEFDEAVVDLDNHLKTLFKQLTTHELAPVPKNLNAQLRPYQERGFNWLVQNLMAGFGSILADDMGLGKTVQTIAALLHCKNKGLLEGKCVLLVVPTGLISNWKKELERFAPDLSVAVYYGKNRELTDAKDILITSYGLLRRDINNFNKMSWFLIVIDEAQNIKNPNTDQTKALKVLDAQHKIALSGTPVENRLSEYWSIFDFTNRHYLGSQREFVNRFVISIEQNRDKKCLDRFKKITAPFLLRRLKSDKTIIKDLPEKIETNRYCSLTADQVALYQEVVNNSLGEIEEEEGIARKGLVLKLMNSLKQICNHPGQFGKKKIVTIEESGKMQILEEIITGVNELGEKALIFTQYTQMGDLIVKAFEERFKMKIPFLHGGCSTKERDAMVEKFQNDEHARILIVSLKAGGTGLNLTAANHVIHYDLWWNPAVEAQATDRAFRIGQKRNVLVHRLISTGTFEEEIDRMIQHKKELTDLVVGSDESWITEMSNEQLRNLVKLRDDT